MINSEKNKTTIMYIIDDLCIGGAQKVLLNTVRSLDKRKYKIVVVSLFDGDGLADEMKRAGAELKFLHMSHKFDLRVLLKLVRIIRLNNISLVHTHLHIANFWGRLSAKIAGSKVILATIHNYFYSMVEYSAFRKTIYRLIDRIMFPISSRIIAVSEDLERWLIKNEKVGSSKFIAIYNSIDLNEYSCNRDGRHIREELNIHNGFTLLGNVQPMREKNQQQYIIYSMSQIAKTFPKVKLLMIGDGPERKNLERLVKRLRLEKSVLFLGFRRDIPEILSAIDIFVSCPLYESFGMVILEAMAMQKPVITTKVGGIPEVVMENETALLVEPQNAEQLSKAIMNLLNNKVKREQMGFMGRKRTEKHFSSEIITGKLEALYKQLLREAA